MAPRLRPTTELAAFLKRFAWHDDPFLRDWIESLRIGSERTLYGAWLACTDGAAMLRALGADLKGQGSEAHRRLVLATCACARLAACTAPAITQALEATERWARGDPGADLEGVALTLADAWVSRWEDRRPGVDEAVWAAQAVAAAGRDVAWAAQEIVWATRKVAAAAQEAAAAQGAPEAEAMAAYRGALAQCAELIRGVYPRPPYRDPITGSEDEATYWLEIVDDPSVDPAARRAAGARVLEIEAEIQGG